MFGNDADPDRPDQDRHALDGKIMRIRTDPDLYGSRSPTMDHGGILRSSLFMFIEPADLVVSCG